jgi:muramoyltetrapeptide carboxypeptidase
MAVQKNPPVNQLQSLVRPRPLLAGEEVGVIALAAAVERERFAKGRAYLEAAGFRSRVLLDPSADYGVYTHLFASDSPTARSRALQILIDDSEIRAILAARGAYGSAELLPLVDFSRLRANPKVIVGFSDITAVLIAAYQDAGVVCVHGPSLESGFTKAASGNVEAGEAVRLLLSVLGGGKFPVYSFKPLPSRNSGGAAVEGPLVGGNLTLLCSLMGTPWEPHFDDHIVFLEEVGERPYRIHRLLLQLKLAGKFKAVRGVVFGTLRDCEPVNNQGPDVVTVMRDIFKDAPFPVLMDGPFGHIDRNLPMPLGIRARLSGAELTFTEDLISR